MVLRLKAAEVLLRCHWLQTFYERKAQLFLDLVSKLPDGVVVDIGANLGQYAFPLARLPNCLQVLAYEPQPDVFKLLNNSVQFCRMMRIKTLQVALSSKLGSGSMNKIAEDGYVRLQESYLSINIIGDGNHESQLPVSTLDEDLRCNIDGNGPSVIAIKMDVEGHELDVLLGARDTLENFRPIILAELVDSYLQRSNHSLIDVVSLMNNANYCFLALDSQGALKKIIPSEKSVESGNYLLVPAEKLDWILSEIREMYI